MPNFLHNRDCLFCFLNSFAGCKRLTFFRLSNSKDQKKSFAQVTSSNSPFVFSFFHPTEFSHLRKSHTITAQSQTNEIVSFFESMAAVLIRNLETRIFWSFFFLIMDDVWHRSPVYFFLFLLYFIALDSADNDF